MYLNSIIIFIKLKHLAIEIIDGKKDCLSKWKMGLIIGMLRSEI